MILRIYLRENLDYYAFFIDYECRADGFSVPGSINLHHFMIRIGNKVKRKVIFIPELLVRIAVVTAYSYNRGSFFHEQGVGIPERAGLFRAAGSIVLRVKIQNNFSSLEIGERNHGTRIRRQLEIRGLLAFFYHTLLQTLSVYLNLKQIICNVNNHILEIIIEAEYRIGIFLRIFEIYEVSLVEPDRRIADYAA